MKDIFSSQSDHYARFRPTYPPEFYAYLNTLISIKENAWDCGTGNGQVALELAKSFERVFATDISASQIANAVRAENISYSVKPVEHTDFDADFFDLIIAAQAAHWFDLETYYAEVRRTARDKAILCLLGYGRITISPRIDRIIDHFYAHVLGAYWDEERRHIEAKYETLAFPFKALHSPQFEIKYVWNLKHLIGYLNTWSAVKHYIARNRGNPVDDLEIELMQCWKTGEIKMAKFPMFLKIGYVPGTP